MELLSCVSENNFLTEDRWWTCDTALRVRVSFAWEPQDYTSKWDKHQRSCRAVPTLSPPQWYSCSASELPSPRLCVFSSGPSAASSSLCITPAVLLHEGPPSDSSGDLAGHATGEPLSACFSEAFFSWILLLISFWNLHICSCSSLMKFTTLWRMQCGRKENRETCLEREEGNRGGAFVRFPFFFFACFMSHIILYDTSCQGDIQIQNTTVWWWTGLKHTRPVKASCGLLINFVLHIVVNFNYPSFCRISHSPKCMHGHLTQKYSLIMHVLELMCVNVPPERK